MDFFPSLGEPGILDELFWFGPLVLQVVLGVFFFWVTGRWMRKESRGTRVLCGGGMVIGCDVLLFLVFGIIFKASTGL